MYKQFISGVDSILESNAILRGQIEVGDASDLYSFGTIRIGGWRRIGKTTYIREHYVEGDLVIVPTLNNYVNEWTRSFKVVGTLNLENSIRVHAVKTCWVDDASIVFKSIDPFRLCQLLMPTGCARIVALG